MRGFEKIMYLAFLPAGGHIDPPLRPSIGIAPKIKRK